MPFQLKQFTISNLYGYRTVDIRISDNRLVLIGENGTGKTTVLNILCFMLARQWHRIESYEFDRIELVVSTADGSQTETVSLDRSDVRALARFSGDGPYRWIHRSAELQRSFIISGRSDISFLTKEADEDLRERMAKVEPQVQALQRIVTDHIVYWPTYRRIERDLESISNLDLDDLKEEITENLSNEDNDKAFLELVEYGVQEVERRISTEMARLTRSNHINDLPGTFLNDVIKPKYSNVEAKPLFDLSEDQIDGMLRRLRENLVPEDGRKALKQSIDEYKAKGQERLNEVEKVTLQLLVRLHELHKRQNANERSFVKFKDICNKYLRRKAIVFDNTDFSFEIRIFDEEREQTIELNQLSSGEQQILSLFSLICLTDRDSFFVLIDEPELSLSVPWQREFLPDIIESEKCAGLIAVTHSPFIYENELKPYARAITEFWK